MNCCAVFLLQAQLSLEACDWNARGFAQTSTWPEVRALFEGVKDRAHSVEHILAVTAHGPAPGPQGRRPINWSKKANSAKYKEAHI